MSLPAQTFHSITPTAFIALKEKVAAKLGITITTDSGQDTAQGFTVSWDYDSAEQELTIQVLSKPWYVPASLVQSEINSLFGA